MSLAVVLGCDYSWTDYSYGALGANKCESYGIKIKNTNIYWLQSKVCYDYQGGLDSKGNLN